MSTSAPMPPPIAAPAPTPLPGPVACLVPASTKADGAVAGSDPRAGLPMPLHPSDILLELVTCILAPLFMVGCCGDLSGARLAAIETIASYQSRTQAELIRVSQIIAFGLAAMDNLRLSMAPNLSLSMTLRLRGCANALNRSAQQNVAALERSRRRVPSPGLGTAGQAATVAARAEPASSAVEVTEEDIQAAVMRACALVAQAQARPQSAQPDPLGSSATQRPAPEPATPELPAQLQAGVQQAPVPQAGACHHVPTAPRAAASPARLAAAISPEPVVGQATMPLPECSAAERQRLMWASAMGAVAGRLSGGLAHVPAAQRKVDRMWADALGSHASSLAMAAGSVPPGTDLGVLRVDKKLKPA